MLAAAALAQDRDPVSPGTGRAVLLATNSIQVDQDVVVVSGDLVVNDLPDSPILGESQLSLDRRVVTPAGWNVIADRIDIDRDAVVGGDAWFNHVKNDGTILGAIHQPLALPVFANLPQPVASPAGTQVVFVPAGQTVDVEEGAYSLFTVAAGGVARLTGSGYSFLSITVSGGGSVVCTGACTVAVQMDVTVDANGTLAGADPGSMRVHTASDATFGRDAVVGANVFAPDGKVILGRGVQAEGAFHARDIHVQRDARLTLDSSFNAPPSAHAQSVFTNGGAAVPIVLTGSDPEGQALQFAIVGAPTQGSLSPLVQNPPSSASVTYTPAGSGDVQDAFTFSVTDPGGAVGTAVVAINPPREEPPDPAPATVIADDASATITQEAAETLLLTARAPDGVALTFSIVSGSGPFHGTLGSVTGDSVAYTPDAGYTGPDAFQFQACGVVGPDLVCDTATFSLNVIALRVELPDLAHDIEVTGFANRDLLISLGLTSLETLRTTRIRPNAAFLDSVEVAGTVADANDDGIGDNTMVLPAEVPVFMSAGVDLSGSPGSNGTVRMHFEWDLSTLGASPSLLRSAAIQLQTHRGTIDSLPTIFYFMQTPGDGALTDADFGGTAERIRGGVMDVPPSMAVGDEGTFTLGVLGELQAAMGAGMPFFTVQGRVDESLGGPARGLEVRTSSELNRAAGLEPMLAVTTPGVAIALTYSVTTLPLNGTLFDGTTEITSAPHVLSGAQVTFRPASGFVGQTSFGYEVNTGQTLDAALVSIFVIQPNCAVDPEACDDGR